MKKVFLLYIDILGFSQLVIQKSEKIKLLYEIIDSLLPHQIKSFRIIVFSDTILITEGTGISFGDDSTRLLWYLNFVQELFEKTFELDVSFRAILTKGEFEYKKMKNIESYYEEALIRAYNKEKEINAIGFFVDRNIWLLNSNYKTEKYDEDLNFVYTLPGFDDLSKKGVSTLLHLNNELFDIANEKEIIFSINLLERYYKYSLNHDNPKVRIKFLHTYSFYKRRYNNLLSFLELNNFNYKSICPEAKWS